MLRDEVHFRFEGHRYAVADLPPEGYEELGRVEVQRLLAEVLGQRDRAACATIVEHLLERLGEGAVGARRDPATLGYRIEPMDVVRPPRLWRQVVVRGPLELHPFEVPRLLELASTLVEDEAWIEVLVVDEQDQPIPHQEYEIRLSDGRVRTARTNEHGILRYEWLPDGECEISLLGLDEGAWEAA